MRVLFLIGCLLISVNVFAQTLKRDTFYNDTEKKKFIMRSAAINSNRSYITVDDKVYTGLLDSLNTDSIEKFSVIKSVDAMNLFGKKAKNGAILIKMKEHIATDLIELPPRKKDITDYILDGRISNEKEVTQVRQSILNITFLKYDTKSVAEELKGKITLVAVTRNFAINSYQKKISDLSGGYRDYLKSHSNNDVKLLFVINKLEYPVSTDERIKKLYDLFSGNATFRSFNLHYVTMPDKVPSFVEINFKHN
jgi:hypothetical protein